ncbi:MAG TPA: hemerythrin domain-containing protein [Xanthobacteraceae bacterium]|nr:hemerythrin domain-containing protein [Xanthobacteraceae bacterium]
MSFANRISQSLHEEHRATAALMERLEQLISRSRRSGPPDAAEAGIARLLSDLSTSLEVDVARHFDFEEEQLFSYLDAVGDTAIGAHLTEEHAMLRPLGARIATLARQAAGNGFDQLTWGEFCRLGSELCERMLAHVQKEEMALLPLLEENMDADTEMRLYEEYIASA